METIRVATEPDARIPKKVFILGGYGNTGKLIAKHLLQECGNKNTHGDLQVIIAGRNLDRAKQVALELGSKATACRCDASDPQLAESPCMQGIDLLVVASPTSDHVENVVRACFKQRIDYFDIQLSNKHKLAALNSHKQDIQEATLCFVTDGGFHPGLPGAMIRYAAANPFSSSPIPPENILSAKGYCNLSMDFNSIPDATDAMFEGFLEDICSMEMRVYGGDPPAWKNCTWLTPPVSFDFGTPFGNKQCIPIYMEELNEVVLTIPTVQEMGFYMAGFHWFADMVVLPFCMLALGIFGKRALPSVSKLFASCLRKCSKPPYGSTISLLTKHAPKTCNEPAAEQHTSSSSFQLRRITVSHVDAYELTAIPAVACLLQMLEDKRPAGLFYQATFVEPMRFFDDMRRMGVTITVEDDDPTTLHQ